MFFGGYDGSCRIRVVVAFQGRCEAGLHRTIVVVQPASFRKSEVPNWDEPVSFQDRWLADAVSTSACSSIRCSSNSAGLSLVSHVSSDTAICHTAQEATTGALIPLAKPML